MKRFCASLLMVALLLLTSGCTSPPKPSEAPLIVPTAKPVDLPKNILSIDPTPSTDYSLMAASYLRDLESWWVRASALSVAGTPKSKP